MIWNEALAEPGHGRTLQPGADLREELAREVEPVVPVQAQEHRPQLAGDGEHVRSLISFGSRRLMAEFRARRGVKMSLER